MPSSSSMECLATVSLYGAAMYPGAAVDRRTDHEVLPLQRAPVVLDLPPSCPPAMGKHPREGGGEHILTRAVGTRYTSCSSVRALHGTTRPHRRPKRMSDPPQTFSLSWPLRVVAMFPEDWAWSRAATERQRSGAPAPPRVSRPMIASEILRCAGETTPMIRVSGRSAQPPSDGGFGCLVSRASPTKLSPR